MAKRQIPVTDDQITFEERFEKIWGFALNSGEMLLAEFTRRTAGRRPTAFEIKKDKDEFDGFSKRQGGGKLPAYKHGRKIKRP